MNPIECLEFGGPSQIVDRFTVNSTSGPVAHVRTRCVKGRVLTALVEHIESAGQWVLDERGSAPALEGGRVTRSTLSHHEPSLAR